MRRHGSLSLAVIVLLAGFTSGGLERGNRLFAQGKYEAAAAAYRQALRDGKDSPELEYNLGTALLKLRRYADAEQAFKAALSAVDPSLRQRTYYNLGSRFLEAGRGTRDPRAAATLLSSAVRAYKQALELTPADTAAKWNYELALREQQGHPRPQTSQSGQPKQPQPQNGSGGGGSSSGQATPQPGQRPSDQSAMTREEAAQLLSAVEQNEREVFQQALRKAHPHERTLRNW